MKRFLIPFLIVCGCILGNPEDVVNIMVSDFPPYIILKGDYKKQGTVDYVIKEITKSLDDVRFEFLKANPKRKAKQLNSDLKIIHPTALKTKEREKYSIFSFPYIILFPNCLIMKSKTAEKLSDFYCDKDQRICLEKIIKSRTITLGVVGGRKYGGSIDSILNKYSTKKNITKVHDNNFRTLYKLLVNDRVDMVIGYPSELDFFRNNEGSNIDFSSFTIKGMPEFQRGHFAFPKNPWGEAMLKRIEPVLKEVIKRPDFQQKCLKWLDKNARRKYLEIISSLRTRK